MRSEPAAAVGGAMLAVALLISGCRGEQRATRPAQPNVLLVTIDTFRADRVGVGVAPAIDQLAASALQFTAARAAVPLTLPSHVSIHTGLLPPAHGVRANGATLADSHRTLASLLKGAGYDTAAFIGAFVLDRRFGLAQGFDTYDDQIPRDPNATERLEAERPAAAVVDRALAWLAGRIQDQGPGTKNQGPFFMWVHLYDPHAPYDPPAAFRARTPTPYDGEVAYADAQFARLLEALRAQHALERTLVVVAGDHGEGLGDHGERTHGMLLYDSTLRVPLVMAAPGHAAAIHSEAVSLVDLAPTILRAAGVAPPDAMKGRNLLSSDASRSVRLQADRSDDLYSETEYPRIASWSPLQALLDGRWKAIRAGSGTELYDLHTDPREEHDLAGAQTSMAAAMAARAAAIHASATGGAAPAISADAQERLRALGYVASSTPSTLSGHEPSPAAHIATWNEFEDALSALSAHRPEALGALKRLAASSPDARVMQSTYGQALKDAGQLQAALAVYRDAVRRWPADAALLHDLAAAAREAAGATPASSAVRALREEAERADRAALVLDPNSAIALNGLGLLAIDQNRPADAATSFERATANDPNNASYWANLGNARRAVGDRAGAEQAYRRALDVDARAADAANGLGVLLVESNRPADATPYFERAIAASPDLVEARLNLGIALQQSGQLARAAEMYRQVLAAPARNARERKAAATLLAALEAKR